MNDLVEITLEGTPNDVWLFVPGRLRSNFTGADARAQAMGEAWSVSRGLGLAGIPCRVVDETAP